MQTVSRVACAVSAATSANMAHERHSKSVIKNKRAQLRAIVRDCQHLCLFQIKLHSGAHLRTVVRVCTAGARYAAAASPCALACRTANVCCEKVDYADILL